MNFHICIELKMFHNTIGLSQENDDQHYLINELWPFVTNGDMDRELLTTQKGHKWVYTTKDTFTLKHVQAIRMYLENKFPRSVEDGSIGVYYALD